MESSCNTVYLAVKKIKEKENGAILDSLKKKIFTNTANHRLVTTRLPDSAVIAVFSVYSFKIPGTL